MSVQGRALQNPFPGLRPFEPDEDYLFFGREEQTIELLSRLAENRFVAVVGTSGSGKSSLVRCGLLSELLGGKLRQAGAAWEIAVTHPGGNPLALLAESLLEADLYDPEADHARENLLATLSRSHFGLVEAVKQSDIGADTNFLLVVDQFEEIFRFHEAGQAQKEVANEFVSLLLEAVTQSAVPIYVVLTMRSDFIGECGQFEGLAEVVNRGEFLIPRLNREQYKRVIEGPVKVAGGEITPRLLQRLLNDLGQQADQLPCLQHALMRTWNVWSETGADGAIDLHDYQRIGKMTQALSLHADEVYESLASDRQRELCRQLFQALTVQESENRGIRRPQRLDRLCQILEVSADELLPVIDAYRRSGVTFLMPSPDVELSDRTIIDISHESLMRVWTRLRYWVEEEAQAAGIYRRLSESAALHQQGEAGLYRDPELGIALAWQQEKRPNQVWAERYRPGFESAMKFLQASDQAERAEAEAREAARQRELSQAKQLADVQRRSAQRLRWLVSGLAVVALFAVVATINAVRARRLADDAKIAALASEDLALENAGRAQREAARALAQEAAAKKAEEAATAAKSEAEAATDAFEQQLYLSDMTLADHSYDEGNVGRVTQMLLDHVPPVDATDDPRGFEWFHLWAGAHRVSKTFQPDRGRGSEQQSRFGVPVLALAVSPGGGKGAASYRDGVAIFDAQTHEVLSVVDPGSEIRRNAYIALSFSPNGKRLAAVTEEGNVQVWDANTYATVRRKTTSTMLRGAAFSAAEPLLASGGWDGYVYLWDTESWDQLELSESVGLPIECLAFSPNGTRLALGTRGATSDSEGIKAGQSRLILWDVANRETITTRQDHEGTINAVTWSSDGQSVVSAAADGTVRIWDSELSPLETVNVTAPVQTIAFSPDGNLLAAGMSRTNTVRIVATDTWEPVTDLKGQSSAISAVAFIGDSKTLLAGGDDGQLQV
jgi:WD40 repeat protein